MKIEYQNNISKSYGYSFFSFFGITSLWVLYLQMKGLSLVEVGVCESIFHVASFVFEVPSGLLADRFSYRFVLICGRVAAIVSALLMLFGNCFLLFALGFIFSALSYNLQSGTIEALIYDSLTSIAQTDRYPSIISKITITSEFADTAGVVLAGFLVHWHFGLTYVLAAIFGFFGMLTVIFLKEPPSTHPNEQAVPRPTTAAILKAAADTLKKSSLLRNLMLFHALFSTICTLYYFYFQSLMEKYHFPGGLISALMIIAAVINICGLRYTPLLQQRLSKRTLIFLLTSSLLFLLLLTWVNQLPLLCILFLFSQLLSSVIEPIFSSYYNTLISSAQRATLLSVASALFSLIMSAILPLAGWLLQNSSFSFTFGSCGVIFLLILSLVSLKRCILK